MHPAPPLPTPAHPSPCPCCGGECFRREPYGRKPGLRRGVPTTFRDATLSWRPKTGIPPETCRNFGHPYHRLPLTVQVRFAWGWRKSGFPVINSHADSLPQSRHAAAVWPFYFLACKSHADPGPRSRHAAAVWPFYSLACNSHADLGPPDCAVHAVKHGMNPTIRSPWAHGLGGRRPKGCSGN